MRFRTLSTLWCLGLLFGSSNCFAQRYTIKDLGTLGGCCSYAWGINSSGQVVGYSDTATFRTHAFRTHPNEAIDTSSGDDLGSLVADRNSRGYAINDLGQVVGLANMADGSGRAFLALADSGISADLGLADSSGVAVNNSGQVAGTYWNTSVSANRSFRTAAAPNNSMVNLPADDIGTLGDKHTLATGMNNLGQVVGHSYNSNDGSGPNRAFRTNTNGTISDLGTLGGTYAYATAINDSGQVVGHSTTAANDNTSHLQAFRTGANSAIGPSDGLGTLGGCCSVAYGINSVGQVVGYASTTLGATHAFVWSEASGMQDLNELIPADAGWNLYIATGINESGQIAGYGYPCTDYNCNLHAYLLTPMPTDYAAHVQPPIDSGGSSIFRAGRGVVPVKFTLTQNDVTICELPPATIAVKEISDAENPDPIATDSYNMAADSGPNFRIDVANCQYAYNISAKALPAGTYRVDISIDTAVVGSAKFALE